MRYCVMFAFFSMIIISSSWAGGSHHEANSSSTSASTSTSAAAAIGIGGDSTSTANVVDSGNSSVVVDNTNTVSLADAVQANLDASSRLNNQITYQDRIQHVTPSLGQECIGSVCRSTSALTVTGGYDQETGQSINVGVVIPLGGRSATSRAMGYEAEKLADRNLQDREKHQAEMMSVCLELHKLGVIHTGASPELWDRCGGFEHHSPSKGDHAGLGAARQVSPHH